MSKLTEPVSDKVVMWMFRILIFVGVCWYFGLFSEKPKPTNQPKVKKVRENSEPSEPPISIHTYTLWSKFKLNQLAADNQFLDKRIRTEGKTYPVKKDNVKQQYYVPLDADVGESYADCYFRDQSQLANLDGSTHLTLECTCKGYMYSTLILEDCIILKKGAK